MQKTFIKNTVFIITAAIFLILFISVMFSVRTIESQQFNSFHTKTTQVIHTLENNRTELSLINKTLDEDYLTRAKAAEYMLEQEKTELSVKEMQYIAKLLNVDELHVIDEKGIIVSGSISKYVGLDMADHVQTRPFLTLLENNNDNAYLIQAAQPNAAENKMMKYVGVAMKEKKGIVQVGFKPTRQMEAESKNTYEYIFSKFPTDVGEELFAIDCTSGEVLGHSGGMDRDFSADYYQLEKIKNCTEGAYRKGEDGGTMYVASAKYNNIMICAALPRTVLFRNLLENTLNTLLYLLFVEAAVILLLNYLVKRKVVNGIHHIIENLDSITNGNFDTVVSVGGNPEFEKLSDGINRMVKSIVSITDRISAIIEVSGVPLAAFEYDKEMDNVFVTKGLGELLDISAGEAEKLFREPIRFDQYIRKIMETPIEGEQDVYQINDRKYIRIHMKKSAKGYLGVITDVSSSVMKGKRLEYENAHDNLTGLYIFAHFKQLVTDKIRNMAPGKICALVMMDLDNFKSINDTFGHDMGDRYLQRFAEVMMSMPSEHFLPARRSGDEFCILIYDCDSKSEIIEFLDKFYYNLRKNYVELSDTESRTIAASAGFACTDDSSMSILELLNQADEALYDRKKGEKGGYAEYMG